MRMNYDIAERQGGLLEEHVDKDPLKQFDRSAACFQMLERPCMTREQVFPRKTAS